MCSTEEKVREEKQHIQGALRNCGYPKWALNRVKQQISHKKEQKKVSNTGRAKNTQVNNRSAVVVSHYIQGTTEAVSNVLKKYNVTTAVRPNTTLRTLPVSPKDRIPKDKQCGVVYQVPRHNCKEVYIGETGRQLGVRIDEHKKQVEDLSRAAFTRTKRKASTQEQNKPAITDHGVTNNHVIDCSGVRVINKEGDMTKRKLREAI